MSQIKNKFIEDNAITVDKIASDAIGESQIQNGAVTEAKLDALSVSTVKIQNSAVTDAKIASGVDAGKIADGSVSNTEFQFLNGVTSGIQSQLDGKIDESREGVANGIATLDAGGKIPVSQLPNSIMEFQGQWNASTNTPTLADGTGNIGDVYRVNVAGTQNLGSGSITFAAGDWVMYNGTVWQKAANSDIVGQTLAGEKETFTLVAGDITNQYIDLANVALTDSIDFIIKGGAPTLEGAAHDYSVNYTGGAGGNTRITFLNDIATGGPSALVAGDVIQVKYLYEA